MTGLVGMMTTVPPPGEVVATVEELRLDGARGVRIPNGGRTMTGFLDCVSSPSFVFSSDSSSPLMRSAKNEDPLFLTTVLDEEASGDDLVEVADVVVVDSELRTAPVGYMNN